MNLLALGDMGKTATEISFTLVLLLGVFPQGH